MEQLKIIASVCAEIGSIVTLLCLVIKPIRLKLFGLGQINEGLKCLLRDGILKTYYNHKDKEQLPRYSKESMLACYEAYKALGGNSFIQDLVKEMREWEVI